MAKKVNVKSAETREPTNGVVGISFRSYEEIGYRRGRRHAKIQREGFCRVCGSPLKSEKSKKRGVGHICAKNQSAIIVLDIRKLQEDSSDE